MTNEELIQKFNPARAMQLTDEDIEQLRALSTEQLGVLARAYPNQANQRPYLLLRDSTLEDKKQLYPLGTFQSLYNLHKFHHKTNFSAYTFKVRHQPPKKAPALRGVRPTTTPTGKVVDLSASDAARQLREQFGAPGGAAAPAAPAAPAAGKKPPAKKNPAPAKTVDVGAKGKALKRTKGAPPEESAVPDDEQFQDFTESPQA